MLVLDMGQVLRCVFHYIRQVRRTNKWQLGLLVRMTMKIRILLADDHTILRAGLKMMLNAQPDMEVVGEAHDGRHAISEVQRLQPDIVLIDITMPDMNCI